jgi:hypothetical protein
MKHFRRAGREIAIEETPEDFVYGRAAPAAFEQAAR